MVYYGAVSKGCQRCRQRKIKCDQRNPGCLRCEKAKTKCPGYRNLVDVVFRDESERIIRRACKLHGETQIEQPKSPAMQNGSLATCSSMLPSSLLSPSISPVLSLPTSELGATFFFTNYTCDGPPLPQGYQIWLTQIYCEDPPNHALRAIIEAVGMAGISNVSFAPQVASRSKEHYGRALAATKQALGDPVVSVADTTLMTIILLGLFEFITFESWDHYRSWAAHIEGATVLLQLRGREQFNCERGAQLFMQLRSQILYDCMQQELPAPPALVRLSRKFEASTMGERRKKTCPGPMGNLCIRLLDLRAAIKGRKITDLKAIRDAATEMDHDLEVWRASLQPTWSYTTVDVDGTPAWACFEQKRHVYSSPWIAQAWNNWRALRILVCRIILQNQISSGALDSAHDSTALSLIHQLSTEICISTTSLMGSPRTVSLIWPLSVVSQESSNPNSMRCWAIEQLRHINSSMGFRHAGLLADTISQGLNGSGGDFPRGAQCTSKI